MTNPDGLPVDPGAENIQGPQEPTAPGSVPAAEATPPTEDVVDLKVEDEQYQLPRSVIQNIAERFGTSEQEAVRILQMGRDKVRHYEDIRHRSVEIARREAALEAKERALQEERSRLAPPAAQRPKVSDDPMAFWEWTAGKLERLDAIDTLMGRIQAMEERAQEAESEKAAEEMFYAAYEEYFGDAGVQKVPPQKIARIAQYYGFADRVEDGSLSMGDMIDACYRIATFGAPVPAARQAAAPPPRPRVPSAPRLSVPRPAGGAPPHGTVRPGETLEERRNRLMSSELANMTFDQLGSLEER